MYAIAYKETPRSSWKMKEKVYDDREKADAIIASMLITCYAVERVYFDEK